MAKARPERDVETPFRTLANHIPRRKQRGYLQLYAVRRLKPPALRFVRVDAAISRFDKIFLAVLDPCVRKEDKAKYRRKFGICYSYAFPAVILDC